MSPRYVAHRGAHSASAPENTLAAIRAAVELGADVVEIDVRVTRDGEVVLLHDETLERIWGDPRRVAELTLAEVREFGGGARRIPTLAEALAALRGVGVPLLIDMDHEDPALPSVAVVRGAGAENDVEWCGATPAMRLVRAAMPEAVIHQAWYTAEPPSPAELAELAPAFVNAQHLLVGPVFLDAVHAAGARAACWTVDDPAQAAHLAALGVDSLTSNDLASVRGAVADEPARRLSIVEELAGHAAEIVARARREGVGTVDTKTSPADHVTEVDRGVERWVRAVIGAQFPEHDMVGEEYGGASSEGRPCWYLDPVDGTANLANGVPWTSFSLALVDDGRPVVGAVLDPIGGVPIVAAEGRGAWRAGERLAIADAAGADPLSGRIVTTELAGADPWPGFVPLLKELAARHCTTRVPGSGTATLAGVALGRGVAAMVHRYNPIDHAAAILVVAEAGGAVLDDTGSATLRPSAAPVFTGAVSAAAALAEAYAATRPSASRIV